ncbi:MULTISPECIES: heavy-metal-associated domain-containing protein [Persicobacter]|uniref:HMA domain-containing protein n=1 Tax=Persicobacter diffluens TaxID=981 RepID=A0AAN4VYT4_9BACT|nr:hypothetical protein [Persicobacter sp. CCB-QB2]GJM61247.1 hypothetical protein PEDI_17990 [Persicobacter diffluens]
MKHQFKTNINCGGCIDKVSPAMNAHFSKEEWSVDTSHQDKILSVETNKSQEEVMEIVRTAGFQISPLKKNLLSKLFG